MSSGLSVFLSDRFLIKIERNPTKFLDGWAVAQRTSGEILNQILAQKRLTDRRSSRHATAAMNNRLDSDADPHHEMKNVRPVLCPPSALHYSCINSIN